MIRARAVLTDAKLALDMLEDERDPDKFRVLWVASMSLLRAVGHVLHKVDAESNSRLSDAVASAFSSWKNNRHAHAIFWDFIEEERNNVLKQYELGFFGDPVDLNVDGQIYTLGENLFCPMVDGPFAGEDCRDVFQAAIAWWDDQLADIEKLGT